MARMDTQAKRQEMQVLRLRALTPSSKNRSPGVPNARFAQDDTSEGLGAGCFW